MTHIWILLQPPPDTPQEPAKVQKEVKSKEEPEKKKNETPNDDNALENGEWTCFVNF